MPKLPTLILLITILAACSNSEQESTGASKSDSVNRTATTSAEAVADTTLRLQFFPSIPDTIDGCSGLFTYDTTKAESGRYIFIFNLTQFAIIRIYDRDIYLTKDGAESKALSDDSYVEVFRGQGYRAELRARRIRSYDEGGFYSGTLQISRGHLRLFINVHGEAGC